MGLCMERSVEMVVGLVGILKAGGVYVPLDPEYPKERLEFMIGDAALWMVLTQAPFCQGAAGAENVTYFGWMRIGSSLRERARQVWVVAMQRDMRLI